MFFLLQDFTLPSLPGGQTAQSVEQFPFGWTIAALVIIVLFLFGLFYRATMQSNNQLQQQNQTHIDIVYKMAAQDLAVKESILELANQVKIQTESFNKTAMHLMLEVGKLDDKLNRAIKG